LSSAFVTTAPPAPVSTRRPVLPRWFALVQTAAVCGIPTMALVATGLILFTNLPIMAGAAGPGSVPIPTLEFIAMVSLLDTALVALLIRVFLMLSGENSRDVFLGTRPVIGEIWRGLALFPIMLVAVSGLVLLLRYVAPWMQTVPHNPLESYMRTPLEASVFIVVVMLAGGVREELQRGFILHRFEQRLGGAGWGLGIFSVIFGALHLQQGLDAATAVGLLGLLWGVLYLRRRSVVMGVVSHAAFNATQVLLVLFGGRPPV
jgi:membrane protease YdiL (CAAX protease family)